MSEKEYVLSGSKYLIVDPPLYSLNKNILDMENLPCVSFCIPTFNNEDTLNDCLFSIVCQEYPNIEIIIVDGNSTDRTIDIAKKYTDKIYFDSGLLGSARQMSVEKSSGKILAIFDSDIILPHKKWLVNAVRYFNYDERVSTVWPVNVAPPSSSLITRFYLNQWELIMNNRIKKSKGLYGGGNALILRDCINEIGGINTALHWGEDFDWANKLKMIGYKVVYINDPIYHNTMRNLKQFAQKQIAGANTFTSSGFDLMNLWIGDILYEQVLLSANGMITGLFKNRDPSWIVFPLCLLIRLYAYGINYVKHMITKR